MWRFVLVTAYRFNSSVESQKGITIVQRYLLRTRGALSLCNVYGNLIIFANIPVVSQWVVNKEIGDHDVSCATATLCQVMRWCCEWGYTCIYPVAGFGGTVRRCFLLAGCGGPTSYWPIAIGRVVIGWLPHHTGIRLPISPLDRPCCDCCLALAVSRAVIGRLALANSRAVIGWLALAVSCAVVGRVMYLIIHNIYYALNTDFSNALMVLNRTSLNSINALLALSRRTTNVNLSWVINSPCECSYSANVP